MIATESHRGKIVSGELYIDDSTSLLMDSSPDESSYNYDGAEDACVYESQVIALISLLVVLS